VGVDISSEPALDGQDTSSKTTEEQQQLQEPRFCGRALVAEDVLTNRMLIRLMLEKMGLEVTIANDGREAVDKALNNAFDLIFMDIQMPNMNGYEATKALREKGLKTPIVALTADAMKGDDTKCIEAGCDDYMSKPIDRRRLIEIISEYLQTSLAESS
jgi:CheY-like chemotaxis protein